MKGVDNVVADALCRLPDYEHLALLFSITPLDLATLATPISDTFKLLLQRQQEDPLCKKLLQQLADNIQRVLPRNLPALRHKAGFRVRLSPSITRAH